MNNYHDYELSMGAEDLTLQAAPIDWAAIASAGADAVNGPNGVEFCKTIRHGLYCIFALSVLYVCVEAMHSHNRL